ncbi:MAG TPA: sigma-70 family RNA polymerase sigma factor [Bryobacteraceae bacterium]|nr:sigma-70 family RNA polymerase sigma factor [Bryobacteraceae bacterium]
MTKLSAQGSNAQYELGSVAYARPAIEVPLRVDGALALIEGIAKRNQSAFEDVYEKFQKYVFVIAKRLLRSEFEAEEVQQDVFLALWLHPPAVQHGFPSLIAWFTATTKKQCLMRIRRSQKPPFSQSLSAEPEYSERVVDRMVETEKRVKLEREFLHAPPKHLEVLKLAYYEDMGATAIAHRLGLPVITVRKRLDAATSRLHRHFRLQDNFGAALHATPSFDASRELRA